MDASAIADDLKHHPQFFEDHAELFAGISLPHPYAGHAIPIAERQIITLRERVADLESRLRELIRFGGENDGIGEKLHRSTLALFGAADLDTTLAVLYHSLQEDFAVPSVAVRLWPAAAAPADLPELAATSPDLHRYVNQLRAPYCGDAAPAEVRDWFDGAANSRSFALLPLRTSRTFGLLSLASDDPQRFAAGMGTLYLTRLSELASVAAARYLEVAA
jgi:uncharacterized protein YigA (DUF484 family)